MPAFAGVLGADEIENVVAFVLSWDHRPASPITPEPEDEGGFNWLVGAAFVVVALVIVGWLVTRFSQRDVST